MTKVRRNAMKNPPHPGGFVLRQCIEPLGLTITNAATALGVTRTTLSELVNGKRGISPEMAARLPRSSAAAPKAGSPNRLSTTWLKSKRTASSSSASNLPSWTAALVGLRFPQVFVFSNGFRYILVDTRRPICYASSCLDADAPLVSL